MRFEAVFGDVDDDVLIGNVFVLPHDLKIEWREEILVLIADDQRGAAERAVEILVDVDKAVGRGGVGELGDVGFGARGDAAAAIDPSLAQVELVAVLRL